MATVKAETKTTQFGFQFGAALVERYVSHKDYVVIGVKTPKQRFEFQVTPTGLIKVGKTYKNSEKNP